ncbi:MAG TPA: NAD(P)H-hydrate epimerase [Candidatus Omnitrophota bacterium]|nr:NAD(P)H-hydrate epimerase [Candidatus Omnitrophota bacterium]
MKTVTSEQMAELDRHAIEDLGIPSLTLMENAGRETAEEAAKLSPGPKIAVICGKGNNGGDGFVAARYLAEKGFELLVVLLGRIGQIKPEPKTNALRMKLPIHEAGDDKSFEVMKSKIADCGLIVDAIFGIGLDTPLKPPYPAIITWINSLNKSILAVDVPSGLNATTGQAMGAAVRAARTVTFAAAKTGFYLKDGPACTGEIVVKDIGIPV